MLLPLWSTSSFTLVKVSTNLSDSHVVSAAIFPFGTVVRAILNVIGSLVRRGIDGYFISAVNGLSKAFTTTTQVRLSSPFLLSNLTMVEVVASSLALPVLLIGVVQSIFEGSPSRLLKLTILQLPASAAATAVTLYAASGLNYFADFASSQILGGADGGGALIRISDLLIGSSALPTVVGPGLILISAFAVMGVWIEMVVRAAAIYLLICLVPIAALGMLASATRHWLRRVLEVLSGLILVKVVIAISLSLAVGAISSSMSTGGAGFGVLVEGLAMLLVTLVSPYALVRLVPFAEIQAATALEQAGSRALLRIPRTWASAANLQFGQASTVSFVSGEPPVMQRLASWTGYGKPEALSDWDGDYNHLPDFNSPDPGAAGGGE